MAVGLTLAQGGEFAFLVVAAALTSQLLAADVAQFMLVVVGGSMLLTPFLIRFGTWVSLAAIARSIESVEQEAQAAGQRRGHVILVGYGRTGQLLADLLTKQGVDYVALDLDPARVSHWQGQGIPIYLGDASRHAMLEIVGINSASAVVLCTDNHRASERALNAIVNTAPHVPVLLRVHNSAVATEFIQMGAAVAVPEVRESGLHLAEQLHERLAIDEQSYRPLLNDYRRIETAAPSSEGES